MTMPPPPGAWPPPPQPGPPDPREPSWDQLFAPDDGGWGGPSPRPPMVPRPPSGGSNRPLVIGAAVVGVVAVVIGVVVWLARPSDTVPAGGAADTVLPATTRATSDADARLTALLPPGYTADSCTPGTPTQNAVAATTCTRNADAGGPTAATYALFPDRATLTKAFDAVVRASTTVECPGRIQSPGPWRRSATTPQISGTLFCGLRQNRPTVAWTDDARLVLSTVSGEAQGPNLAQLYTWWSSHS